jgi:Zn-dependent protease with chaperone function
MNKDDLVKPTKKDLEQLKLWYRDALSKDMPKIKVGLMYQLGLLVTALFMLLLPLVYIAIVVSVAYLVWIHMTENIVIFENMGPKLAILVYGGPLVVGGILLFFMLKPLFLKHEKPQKPLELDRKDEPILFDFVTLLCTKVGAPHPKKIQVDCEVNASASFLHGFWSIFTGGLVLTIGLPLAAGMNVKQLGGVLAHEFGHFAQGFGMRLSYIIRSVNFWFYKVVYNRDAIDESLARHDDSHGAIVLVLGAARFFVWITSKILWLLMMLGHGVSCFISRQMEYDADRYEIQLSGSEGFNSSMEALVELSVSQQGAIQDLQWTLEDRCLVDNFPALVMHNHTKLAKDTLCKIHDQVQQEKTGWFDTHPASRQRIEHSNRQKFPGMFAPWTATETIPDTPSASILFSDFDDLSKRVSWAYYNENVAMQLHPEMLVSASEYFRRQAEDEKSSQAMNRFFQGQVHLLKPIPLPAKLDLENVTQENLSEQVQRLEVIRTKLVEERGDYAEKLKAYEKAIENAQALAAARGEPSSIRLSSSVKDLTDIMRPYEDLIEERLRLSLCLPKGEDESTDDGSSIEGLFEAAHTIRKTLPELHFMHQSAYAIVTILEELQNRDDDQPVDTSRLEFLTGEVQKYIRTMRDMLQGPTYPFEHADGQVSLQEALIPNLPSSETLEISLNSAMQVANDVNDKVIRAYSRVMSRLALIAESRETLQGLEPLPEPLEESEDSQ